MILRVTPHYWVNHGVNMILIEDALFAWGDWARHDLSIGYPKTSSIYRFQVEQGSSAQGQVIDFESSILEEKVDSLVGQLSRSHRIEAEIVKLTYVHRYNAARVGSALKIGRGQVRERLKFSHGWLEVSLFPSEFRSIS